MSNVFYHTGDLGDIIAALPAIRQLGGGMLLIGDDDGTWLTRKMWGTRFASIAPLLRAQSYIHKVEFVPHSLLESRKGITHDFSQFRTIYSPTICLAVTQATWVWWRWDDPLDLSPWLTVPVRDPSNMVVFSRTLKYHNPHFPWKAVLRDHGRDAVFVGTKEEHEAFTKEVGEILRFPCVDLLDLAILIARSKLFIGNQSAPCWIAMGLGHRLIQETCPECPDSIIPRENAHLNRWTEHVDNFCKP